MNWSVLFEKKKLTKIAICVIFFFFLFLHATLNDSFNMVALIMWCHVIMDSELEGMQVEAVMGLCVRYYLGTFLKEMKETTDNVRQDSWHAD
jgi:hypothetical protein